MKIRQTGNGDTPGLRASEPSCLPPTNVTGKRREPLSDEQRVFVDCLEDILASVPGLRYGVFFEPQEIGPEPYAVFVVQTNPALDLTVAVELTGRAFVVRVNGLRFSRRRGVATRFEWWVERRCQDLERMIGGDLRIVQHTLLSVPVSSMLEAGDGDKWNKIGTNEHGWLPLLSFFLPFSFLVSAERKTVYPDWFESDVDGEGA